ncbi:hypothetical protein [Streptomyces sp. TP-A0874]|uniref:hypothetical protein n=1 Tax=Streptomyces sp. TP-A0874 TaxID=549819 RepID=UPI000ACB8451|nr:hypothetical protein [Streptomyces sp. TP-A0874]
MQPSAGSATPRPAHPAPHPHPARWQSRPVHWLSTAVALAAVLGGTALLQPAAATAEQTAAAARPPADAPPAAGPDPATADYPLDCGSRKVGVAVVREGSSDFDGDGRVETAAVVRCDAGVGTPPSGLYVLAHPADGGKEPRIVETLLDPQESISVTEFAVSGRTITATLVGYSSEDVPRCCPDQERRVKWEWRDGKFVLTALPVAGSV